jgi:intracellular septation protein
MPPVVTTNVSRSVLTGCGYGWAALMLALGSINLYVAASFSFAVWAWFISVGAIGAKLVAFAAQVLALRILVRRRLCAANGALAPGTLPKAPHPL